jgi:signal transduction histidine kinase
MVPLESCKLFGQLSAAEVALVRQVAHEFAFADGQIIFKEGDDGDGIYMVKSGKVQISALVGQGERRPISSVTEGDTFGEMTIIDHDKRSASASADGAAEAYFIPRDDMIRLLGQSPTLMRNLVREISRRLREFNRQYIREVIQAERLALVGRFARSIVHDLKNPLNIIGLSTDMLGMENATPEMRQSSKIRIRKQVDRISNMVNELLEFTRTSQSTTVLSATDYPGFVLPLLDDIRAEVAVKKVEIVKANEPPAVRVAANPQRLARVFYNLVHNATDAMAGGGGGKIFVRFSATADTVTTEVQDSGPGIPEEVLAHLFEPFFTHGKAHGTGLGLSICKRIVEDHQGTMSARNGTDGGGAIFAFTLPVMKE